MHVRVLGAGFYLGIGYLKPKNWGYAIWILIWTWYKHKLRIIFATYLQIYICWQIDISCTKNNPIRSFKGNLILSTQRFLTNTHIFSRFMKLNCPSLLLLRIAYPSVRFVNRFADVIHVFRCIQKINSIWIKVVNLVPASVPFSLPEWYILVPVYISVSFQIYRDIFVYILLI